MLSIFGMEKFITSDTELFFLLCQWSHENRKKVTLRYNFKENDHLKVNLLESNKHA